MTGRVWTAPSFVGGATGVAYGLGMRLLFSAGPGRGRSALAVMSLAFLFLVPVGVGFLSAWVVERAKPVTPWRWVTATFLPILATCGGACLVGLEGWICVLFFLPLALLLGACGGLAGGLTARSHRSRGLLTCVLLLPALVAPVEARFGQPSQLRAVENVIDIDAPPQMVWEHVARVAPISRAELPDAWTHRIGFPRPIEATLSRDGVGGVRNATFEKGVLFVETVDTWEPGRRLGFAIHAERVPPEALDAHVTIGGAYFDVLHGDYTLEPIAGNGVRLHLSSRHRVSTHFNWYARFWTDAVMSDIQREILAVLKKRCEQAARSAVGR